MLGVMQTRDAQRLADQAGMDLVEISPNAEPPVCKIMDFGKFRYEESVKRKEARKNQTRQQTKEIKFHASVDANDLGVKIRKIREFIEEGDKVKVTLQYRGRENAHKELGMEVIQRVIKACEDVTIVEQQPRLIGRLLGCLMAPRPAVKGTQPKQTQPTQQQQRPPMAPRPPMPQAAPGTPVSAPVAPVAAPAPAPVAPAAPVASESVEPAP